MGVAEDLPKGVKLLTAGTPLDLELLPVAQELLQAEVHDLYGCQEIGWLAMDGSRMPGRWALLRSLSDVCVTCGRAMNVSSASLCDKFLKHYL